MSEFKFLHTMIRVYDLEKSLDFYTNYFGMKLLRKKDYESGRFTLAFIGFGNEEDNTVIELTYNWDNKEPYKLGQAFGHIAFGIKDIYKKCAQLKEQGVKVIREPGPMKHGTTEIAFIEDPDGYKIELINI